MQELLQPAALAQQVNFATLKQHNTYNAAHNHTAQCMQAGLL
jgi:hypothetical protein